MVAADLDGRVRLRAFEFLTEQTQLHGEVLPRETLAAGFELEGMRVPLIGPQGIFKPAILPEMPLSITTVPVVEGRERPYEDDLGPDGTTSPTAWRPRTSRSCSGGATRARASPPTSS